MFVEPQAQGGQTGWVEVICGPMFSGKTEELLRRITRAKIARQKVLVFKPEIDTRYHASDVVSHNKNAIESIIISEAEEIIGHCQNIQVAGIDEVQFFDDKVGDVCQRLANAGIRVIVAGLDRDYKNQPFGPMPFLLSTAEYVTKLHAICVVCGGLAAYTFRKTHTQQTIFLGEHDHYEARCRKCYLEG
ncbi:MAG: thymidine kinase [Cytophagales bacterium]|nr:thymidine kinase [Cytophagales bacterium]